MRSSVVRYPAPDVRSQEAALRLILERRLTHAQAERRARVLDAARELASAGGYAAVAMQDVAARAGVARATVYRYFASKDHLLAEVTLEWADELEKVLRADPPRGRRPEARVREVFRRVVAAVQADPKLLAACITSMMSPDPSANVARGRLGGVMAGFLRATLRKGDAGDPDALGMVLGHVLFSALASFTAQRCSAEEMLAELETAAGIVLR